MDARSLSRLGAPRSRCTINETAQAQAHMRLLFFGGWMDAHQSETFSKPNAFIHGRAACRRPRGGIRSGQGRGVGPRQPPPCRPTAGGPCRRPREAPSAGSRIDNPTSPNTSWMGNSTTSRTFLFTRHIGGFALELFPGWSPPARGKTTVHHWNCPRSACKSKEQRPRIQTQPRPVILFLVSSRSHDTSAREAVLLLISPLTK